jgi:hypothetical protein
VVGYTIFANAEWHLEARNCFFSTKENKEVNTAYQVPAFLPVAFRIASNWKLLLDITRHQF